MMKWNADRADSQFSLFIRHRDGRCMNPMCATRERDISKLECSHYWDRGIWITRFDPENCIALCHWCHAKWEDTKQGRYREIMIRIIGEDRYAAMQKRVEDYKYKNIPYLSKDMAIQRCREYLHTQPIWLNLKKNSSSISY